MAVKIKYADMNELESVVRMVRHRSGSGILERASNIKLILDDPLQLSDSEAQAALQSLDELLDDDIDDPLDSILSNLSETHSNKLSLTDYEYEVLIDSMKNYVRLSNAVVAEIQATCIEFKEMEINAYRNIYIAAEDNLFDDPDDTRFILNGDPVEYSEVYVETDHMYSVSHTDDDEEDIDDDDGLDIYDDNDDDQDDDIEEHHIETTRELINSIYGMDEIVVICDNRDKVRRVLNRIK